MLKTIAAMLIVMCFCACAYAGGIDVISLLDVQGEGDIDLLIGATEEQKSQYLPDGKLHSQILAFYVKLGDNGILFDAGLKDGRISAELAKNGINATEVKTILITHLHPDHFGGLVDPEGRKSFPNADVYVGKIELDYWVNELKNENVIYALNLYNVNVFDFGDEVISGVKAIDTTGHTPGHTSFLVENDGEKLLILGDIMHFMNIQLPVPDIAVKYDVDPVKAIQSRKFILDYAAYKNIPVAGMHLTPPGLINVRKIETGYEKF